MNGVIITGFLAFGGKNVLHVFNKVVGSVGVVVPHLLHVTAGQQLHPALTAQGSQAGQQLACG